MHRTIRDLKPNPKNPRSISEDKLDALRATLEKFGDLSGFVENRRTKRLVGGHQRGKVLPPDSRLVLVKKFDKPTDTGTVAMGFFEVGTERYSYRLVDWDETKEKAANIAANKGAGEWDTATLAGWMQELDDSGFDLDLTLFDSDERDIFLNAPDPDNSEKEENKSGDKKKAVCPSCGEQFSVAGRV